MKKWIECDRERMARYGYDIIDNCKKEAYAIMDYLKDVQRVNKDSKILFKVNTGILEVIVWNKNNDYIDYDFYGLVNSNYKVGSGYYSRIYGKINNDNIGKRKLYRTSKGLYFNESNKREYLNDYIIL